MPCCRRDHLARPIAQLLMPHLTLVMIALGGCQRGREGQSPDTLHSGNWCQQHQREPARATDYDKERFARLYSFAMDAFGGDRRTAPALDMVIQSQHD